MFVAVADTSRGMVGCAISSENKWSQAISRHWTLQGYAHIIVTEHGREIAPTVRRLPLSQHVDISLLRRVRTLPWDRQGLVRRGRTPKLELPEQSLAETEKHFELEDHLRVERDLVRFDQTQWTPGDEAATSQKQNSGSWQSTRKRRR